MQNELNQQMKQPNNPIQMFSEFQKFVKGLNGKNPQAIINNMLKSGKMSNEQFEILKTQASQFMNLFGIK